jgi:hypothetical protein
MVLRTLCTVAVLDTVTCKWLNKGWDRGWDAKHAQCDREQSSRSVDGSEEVLQATYILSARVLLLW